jgi:hypothetical protein
MALNRKLILPILYRTVPIPTFLADQLYVDFRVRQFRGLAELAAVIHQINRKDLADGFRRTNPKTLEDVREILQNVGWSDIKDIDREDY